MHFSAQRAAICYRRFASDGIALAEAQCATAGRFGLDVITACSDAFRISADLGGDIVFEENSPPHLARPLVQNRSDFQALRRPDVTKKGSRMADRALAVEEMYKSVGNERAVMGWVDMPFAEACSLCGVSEFMMMMYDEPALARDILKFLTEIVIDFALAQMAAGTRLIGAGDAAASLISPGLYREFALPYEQAVFAAVHANGGLAKLHICGNTTALVEDMINSGADLFNMDHGVDFVLAAEKYGAAGKAFKGNLNPVLLLDFTPGQCREACNDLIRQAGNRKYVLSAGCEIPANVSDEVFAAFCEAGK
jgi:MtaA/CmuA family methyltransferase